MLFFLFNFFKICRWLFNCSCTVYFYSVSKSVNDYNYRFQFFNVFQIKSRKETPGRANVLLGALKELLNTLFSHPEDPNLMCAVKLLKVCSGPLWIHCSCTKWYCFRANALFNRSYRVTSGLNLRLVTCKQRLSNLTQRT